MYWNFKQHSWLFKYVQVWQDKYVQVWQDKIRVDEQTYLFS